MRPTPARPTPAALRARALLVGLGLLCAPASVQAQQATLPAGFFADEIAPLLSERCWPCHGGERVKSGFVMDSRAGLLAGGESGPALDASDLGGSNLLRMVRYADEDHRMPPDGRLPAADVARLERWVAAGAPWEGGPLGQPVAEEAASGPRVPPRDDGLAGWGWVPPRRPSVPAVPERAWVANPIDAFVGAALAQRGLQPAPPADRRTLLRRLSYDLTGLPPTPEQLEAFEADTRADAYERQVERLLAAPEHGQRWARHWLDVVRYAETNGFERDTDKPLIWRYRDWVVDALNRDLPYDEFVRLQLAADELPGVDESDLVATAYYRIGQWDDEPGEGELVGRYDVLDDVVSTTASALLAVNIGCARCHDHPADPIPQSDYYRFVALMHGLTDMSRSSYLADVNTPAEREARRVAEARRDADVLAARQRARGVERVLAAALATQDGQLPDRTDLQELHWVVGAAREAGLDAGPRDVDGLLASTRFDALPQGGQARPGVAPASWRATPPGLEGLLAVDPSARAEAHTLALRAALAVPEQGRYGFRAGGGQRARLWLGDQLVVDADERPGEGIVALDAGLHVLRMLVEADAPAPLTLQWAGQPRRLWRYVSSDPVEPDEPDALGWTRPGYDDSWWRQGVPGLGSRDAPGGRVGTEWTSRDLWARARFTWSGAADSAVLVAHHDEDLELWIDGVPAASAPGFTSDYVELPLSDAARALLTPGEHVLALRCRQSEGAQYAHAAVVPRARLVGASLADAAFGLISLSAEPPWAAEPADNLARFDTEQLDDTSRAVHAEAVAVLREASSRELPPLQLPMAQEGSPVLPMHVHVRGNPRVLGDPVEPGFPVCLDPPAFEPRSVRAGVVSSGRRRALAEWVVDPRHGLAARVLVNRVWQQHFGRGLVPTPNDFGELGERPSHPELLDWLARWFIDEAGWSLRRLHRLIVGSNTWRQSGRASAASLAADPEGVWLSRFGRRRLGSEELRDSVLALAGTLDTRLGGRSVFEPVSEAVLATSSKPHEVWGRSRADEIVRRSLYIKSKRTLVPPLHTAFDGADTSVSCPLRFETTAPTQALTLLNGTLVQRALPDFAARVLAAADDDAGRVAFAQRLAWGLRPDPRAVAADVAWLGELRAQHGLDDEQALRDLCLMLLNSNAFVYVD